MRDGFEGESFFWYERLEFFARFFFLEEYFGFGLQERFCTDKGNNLNVCDISMMITCTDKCRWKMISCDSICNSLPSLLEGVGSS